jgi:hypothetical protein
MDERVLVDIFHNFSPAFLVLDFFHPAVSKETLGIESQVTEFASCSP